MTQEVLHQIGQIDILIHAHIIVLVIRGIHINRLKTFIAKNGEKKWKEQLMIDIKLTDVIGVEGTIKA